MSTATRQPQNHAPAAAAPPRTASQLLDEILELPVSQRQKAVNESIEKYIDRVASVLPASLKDQAERFVKRAEITFSRTAGDPKKDIYTCTPGSIVRTVIEAAEIGLAIDGKLAYGTIYNRNVGTRQKPEFQRECQLQIDYKGLIVVARRSGQIRDAWAREVRDNDVFEHSVSDGVCHLHHTWDARQPRGETFCVYGIVQFADNSWRYEIMDLDELNDIRSRSKVDKDAYGVPKFGPWKTDLGQMRCKTVLRRLLKLYCDDPAVGMAIEIDEREFTRDDLHPVAHQTSRVQASTLSERLAPKPAEHSETAHAHEQPAATEVDESFQPSHEDDAGGYEPEESEATA